MKKLLSALLALAMLFSLTACGGDAGSSGGKDSSTQGTSSGEMSQEVSTDVSDWPVISVQAITTGDATDEPDVEVAMNEYL